MTRMMTSDSTTQRITRLTPRGAVLALIGERVNAVQPQPVAVAAALNAVLAEDVVAPALPPSAIALRDGFPVEAGTVADAGPYAPVALPNARAIDLGDAIPERADAILPFDMVTLRGERLEAIAGIAAGDGVLPAGGDATPQSPLRRAGERIRSIDVGILAAAGIGTVAVRVPRIAVARGGDKDISHERFQILSRAIRDAGGIVAESPLPLETALAENAVDAVIGTGGTGSGQRDVSVNMLARLGRVETHGIAITPGETAALGWIGERPVFLLPGRFDAMVAAWLLIGRYMMAALSGGNVEEMPTIAALKRKITSTIGMTELVPVRCAEEMAEPLASGYLSLTSLARSDGWIVVPADSEGFAAGTPVAVHPWP
jgi:molybdopterin molybdotransferase